MRFFNVLALVSLFFFLIGCDDGATRFVPIDEPDDGSSEITDDTDTPDTTPDTTDTDQPDTTTDPVDTATDTATDTDADTATDTATDTDADTATDTDTDTDADTATDTDTDTDADTATDTGADTDPDTGTPDYCSAVFNGSTSKIVVAHNADLNLSSDTWTIEAWIKQTGELTSNAGTIVGKQNGNSFTYSLSNYYITTTGGWQQTQTTAMKGTANYKIGISTSVSAEATGLTNSGDWTHIALVQTISSLGLKKPSLTLYINGTKVASEESTAMSNSVSIVTSSEALLIGSGFNGLIDSIKISSAAKYTGKFTPAKLSVDSDTIAFWDFSGNANDYEGDMTSTPTNITYSEDCKK